MRAIDTKFNIKCDVCKKIRLVSYRNKWNIEHHWSKNRCHSCASKESWPYCPLAIVDFGQRFKKGEKHHNIPHTEESKEKIRKNTPRRFGSDNNKWKGGISKKPEYKAFMESIRRVRKRLVGGAVAVEEWLELKQKYNNTCLHCKRTEPEIKLTIDHIIPISKGGQHIISNIQPLCKNCNSRKYNKIYDSETYFNKNL